MGDAFVQTVEKSLELVNEAERLAEESPLAAPYYLGASLSPQNTLETPAARGDALRTLLKDAATALPDEQQRLLNISFFERDRAINNTGVVRQLSMSEATYYRHRSAAIAALSQALTERVAPPLRSELPRARPIIDRTETFDRSMTALRASHCVALTGQSGAGKTALAAKIADAWDARSTFWFTVRPGLNDQFDSLAFSLAYFLRRLGSGNLWQQLMADRGRTPPHHALGLMRHDLERVGKRALLCIDETDLLRHETANGAQLLHVLEELRELSPLLLVGQQLVIEPTETHTLFGLTSGDIGQWLAQESISVSAGDNARIASATRGNPAMLRLLISLLRDGDALPDALQALTNGASSETLLQRLWRRLSQHEQQLLAQLSVYDGPCPADALAQQMPLVAALVARGLAFDDGRGAITVSTPARAFTLGRVPAELLSDLHMAAAKVREAHGEFTAAARHYLEAGQTEMAVWLLYSRREIEAARGNALTTRALLHKVRLDDLAHDDDRRALALLRAEHALIVGDPDAADAALESSSWPDSHAATRYAKEFHGYALEQRGQIEQALTLYRTELARVSDSQHRLVERLHVKSGYVYLYRLRDLTHAAREANLALHQAQDFMGLVAEEEGRYGDALEHYTTALETAQQLQHGESAEAATHSHLGHLHMRRGAADQAIAHLQIALGHAQRTGQTVQAVYHQLNLASALIVAGRHHDALDVAAQALAVATALNNPFVIAGLQAAQAEAHLALGDLDAAETCATLSLRQEEEVHRSYALAVLGQIQARRGDAQATSTLRLAIASAVETKDRYAEAHGWRALAAISSGKEQQQAQTRAEVLFKSLEVEAQ